MKVCLIVEGAYPYLTGGVSSWIQQLLLEFKDIEFIIQTIVLDRKEKREFKYKIPSNVIEIRETYLLDDDYIGKKAKKIKLEPMEYNAFESLFFGEDVNWHSIFKFFQKNTVSLDELLTGNDFLEMTKNYYKKNFERIVFSDFIWTMRSMYLPLFSVLKSKMIEADLYHCLSTGYAGVLGSMAKFIYNKPLLISEHGIYTREREEEIIKANWVKGVFKDLWIQQFKKCSKCCYDYANQITALFEGARELQIELGCPKENTNVIHNGVKIDDFIDLLEEKNNSKYVNIGAILRVTPIKDVKTMISAFYLAKKTVSNLKLWIMGPLDEKPKYVEECKTLIEDLGVEDIIFTDKVNVKEYLGKMDFMILSSLSEGQPLVILEGFAAKKPYISTNVGNCLGMIYGEDDNYGEAGVVVPIMNVSKMAEAIIKLAENEELRRHMGEVGYERAKNCYSGDRVFKDYRRLYEKIIWTK